MGSLRIILDAAGTVAHQITYDSFGNILTETASGLTVPFGFAGGLHDRTTGLVRFGYRDYDPDNGRWTAKDIISFHGGATNLYEYCSSDPIQFIDPSGTLVLGLGIRATAEQTAIGPGGGITGGGMILMGSNGEVGALGHTGGGLALVPSLLSGGATLDLYIGTGLNPDTAGPTAIAGASGGVGAVGILPGLVGLDVCQSLTNSSIHGITISLGYGSPGAEAHAFVEQAVYEPLLTTESTVDAAFDHLSAAAYLQGEINPYCSGGLSGIPAIPPPAPPKIQE